MPIDDFDVHQLSNGIFPSKYRLLECQKCKLWFKDKFPIEAKVHQHYNNLDLENDLWNYEKRLPHEKKLDKILKRLPSKAKVLDVGCWTGRLLSAHPRLERFGIEPNPDAAALALERGIHVLGPTVTSETMSGNTFDLVTMIDVFEHLTNPLDIIKLITRQLRPNGKLIIVTGRTNCLPVRLARSTYWYFSIVPDHLVFLNKKFVKTLKNRLSLKSVNAEGIIHYPFLFTKHLRELAWLFIWRFGNPNSPFKRLRVFKLGIFKRFAYLKDILFVPPGATITI
ncbi:MAG: class I SAM-dependent methyltransferase [Flavipsychrobacter sp.]|nr:class I SAM-dependent methyltransferase [Flavipsychrobacter sp.]